MKYYKDFTGPNCFIHRGKIDLDDLWKYLSGIRQIVKKKHGKNTEQRIFDLMNWGVISFDEGVS